MKKTIITFALLGSMNLWSQKDYFTKKGVVVKGYDVTEYFNNIAVEGSKEYNSQYDGATFYFVSEANKNKFDISPEKYIPKYGGYCAYAIAVKGQKVSINPKTFQIRDNKLYLFYNKLGTNTLDLWNEQNPTDLKIKADKYWLTINQK